MNKYFISDFCFSSVVAQPLGPTLTQTQLYTIYTLEGVYSAVIVRRTYTCDCHYHEQKLCS